MTNELFSDRYEIQNMIGKGGMATVYHAIDTRFDRDVAIKVLPREFLHDQTFLDRFSREARTIAGLGHAAIVPIYDYGEHDRQPFMVMAYMPGGSLRDKLRAGPLSLDQAWTTLIRVSEALDAAHARGIIHRDVKPANILYDSYGYAFLSDFGIVKLSEATAQLTGSGIVGTPAYMAPEMMDKGGLTHLIDVYALAVTLYQILTGQQPFDADTPLGLLMAHANKPVPDLRQAQPDLPHSLQAVIEGGMAKDPAERYQSAGALTAAFREAIQGDVQPAGQVMAGPDELADLEPITAPAGPESPTMDRVEDLASSPGRASAPPEPAPVPRKKRQSPAPWAWIGGIGVVIVIGVIGLMALLGSREAAPPAIEETGEVAVEGPIEEEEVEATEATEEPIGEEEMEATEATEEPIEEEVAEEDMAGASCAPNCTYEDMVVGFVQIGTEFSWLAANSASFSEMAEKLGIELKSYDSQNDLASQIAGFRNFIEDDEVNVIILDAMETAGWDEILQEAQDAGKIVILENRSIDASEDLYTTYVSPDYVEEGRKAGIEMCALLEGSESKKVVELAGSIDMKAAIGRGEGFRETMEACGIEIVDSQIGNWNATEGKQVMEYWLAAGVDIQGLFAQNDEMGLGAVEAIEEAGYIPGVDIKIVTVDATASAFTAMLEGKINVSIECNPLIAPQVYEAALKALNGEELPKWIPVQQDSVFRSTDENLEEIAAGRPY